MRRSTVPSFPPSLRSTFEAGLSSPLLKLIGRCVSTSAFWIAPAKRSNDGAFSTQSSRIKWGSIREAERRKAVSRCACHRSPKKCRYRLALVYSSFGFHHSFVLHRQSGSDHSCFVIYRQEVLKFSKDNRDPLRGLRSKTSLNTHRSRDLCSLTFVLLLLLK